MKRVFIAAGLAFGISIAPAFGQATDGNSTVAPAVESKADVSFEKDVHDFGTMKQYGDASTEFKFTNTGTEPLIISNARGSCGCTVPQWPKEPIKPGETAAIKVKYDSKRVGPINKSVTITSNASSGATKVLRIKGMIEAAPKEETFPAKQPAQGAPVSKP